MVKHEVLDQEVWECSDEEIRRLWPETPPEDRYKLWSNSEYTSHILDDPAQVRACLSRKRAQPGRLQTKESK